MEAFKRVKANKGAAGVDDESILEFERDLKNNLYKIWNRMSSGSYFPPPVKTVEIPKADGKKRRLGIPTVSDRIAQMVAKIYLEPTIEPHFHPDSYGYRPGKSAIQALEVARKRCWKYDWLIDIDIKGFFDNIDHELMMRAVKKHTQEPWILLYVQRWLEAPAQDINGNIIKRDCGTPQGGVISPLLANIFLHHAFDEWMKMENQNNPFERYADDIVVHCKTEQEAQKLREAIDERLRRCKLELHPDKTKIVYCKDASRRNSSLHEKFDFLGYTFRPRTAKNKEGELFTSFSPAVSDKAKKKMREGVRGWKQEALTTVPIKEIAKWINPIVRGWINHYGQFRASELWNTMYYVEAFLIRWCKRKYGKSKGSWRKAIEWLSKIKEREPNLFASWQWTRRNDLVRRAV